MPTTSAASFDGARVGVTIGELTSGQRPVVPRAPSARASVGEARTEASAASSTLASHRGPTVLELRLDVVVVIVIVIVVVPCSRPARRSGVSARRAYATRAPLRMARLKAPRGERHGRCGMFLV
jgi:hypothetical protein